MAWEECVAEIKKDLGQSSKEITDPSINWASLQEALDGDTFHIGNPFFIICPNRHCTDYENISLPAHRLCSCKDLNNNPIPDCTPASYLYPYLGSICFDTTSKSYNLKSGRTCTRQGDNWYNLSCYCCCSCFAYGTKIAIPDGFKAIEKFQIGDRVMTAAVEPGKTVQFNWSSAKVTFSSGTGEDSIQPAMVYVHFGVDGQIVVTPDHLFMMSDGKLKRADRLVPGRDNLVSAEGAAVQVNEVSIGEYHGGVHHIATNVDFNLEAENPLSGHLLISEGVVTGDFNLQIHAEDLKAANYFEPDHDDLPQIGTAEYEDLNTSLRAGTFAKLAPGDEPDKPPVTRPQKFYVHGENTVAIPDTAAKYLSALQEEALENVDKLSSAEINISNVAVKYTLKLFGGFFPDIVFFHDVGRLETNAYAFSQYGKRFIVLSGGLTRIKGLGMEGLSLVLSHLIARLQKSDPLDQNGYTSVGMADYYSTLSLRTVYFLNLYGNVYKPGLKQLEDFIFAKLENSKYEEDPFQPDTETRLDAIDAGNNMAYPPEGIGGPTWNGLQVINAEASPATLNANSFMNDVIDSNNSAQVFDTLQQNKILDANGVLADDFSMTTDLSFLFTDQKEENLRAYLISAVRSVLLHSGAQVRLFFNMPVSVNSAKDLGDYEFEPFARVLSADAADDNSGVVIVKAALQRNVEYTVTVSNFLRAKDGSTLDQGSNTATFTMA